MADIEKIRTISASEIIVFLGPSLPRARARELLDATYLHPASQGDILLAAHAFRPKAMILIDGQFEDRPAVRHKEILWAMAQGIVMIGAASMGALRAAELHVFGMVGVGSIFRWYRRWPLAADDAVAVQAGPAELGFLPLTESLIDLQATFSVLERQNMISSNMRHQLVDLAWKTSFRERSLKEILRQADFPGDKIDMFLGKIVRKKSHDAEIALKKAIELIEVHAGRKSMPWVATNTFVRDLEASGIDPDLIHNYNKSC